MMIPKKVFCGVAVCFAGWAHVSLAQTKSGQTRLPNNATILTGAAARPLFKQCSRASPEAVKAYWTPKPVDIQAAEAKLPVFLQTVKKTGLTRSLQNDYRQYAGFISKSGQKCLYLNSFSPDVKKSSEASSGPGRKRFDWKREAMDACDGGDSFWGAEYNTQTKQWSHLAFNGPF